IEAFLSTATASRLGGWILIAIGVYALLQFFFSRQEKEPVASTREVFNVRLKKFGILIKILREPTEADIDRSGTISATEAFLLGCALSFDAFGAGIGAAFVGYPPLFTALLVAFMSGLFLWSGKSFGFHFSDAKWLRKASFLPGLLLILVGLFRMH
ncbi:MAG TPA: sporulation membrane protein YtaF, partial [Bacillales bacterium]|nr:sporulation membrane protein YtaF [Bacillales bacterium]